MNKFTDLELYIVNECKNNPRSIGYFHRKIVYNKSKRFGFEDMNYNEQKKQLSNLGESIISYNRIKRIINYLVKENIIFERECSGKAKKLFYSLEVDDE